MTDIAMKILATYAIVAFPLGAFWNLSVSKEPYLSISEYLGVSGFVAGMVFMVCQILWLIWK